MLDLSRHSQRSVCLPVDRLTRRPPPRRTAAQHPEDTMSLSWRLHPYTVHQSDCAGILAGRDGADAVCSCGLDDLLYAEIRKLEEAADRQAALAAETADRIASLERYARSLEDEIVFRLQDALVAIHEGDGLDEDELREQAGTSYALAVARWDSLFAKAPTRMLDPAPAVAPGAEDAGEGRLP
jgi:hypothetical protein